MRKETTYAENISAVMESALDEKEAKTWRVVFWSFSYCLLGTLFERVVLSRWVTVLESSGPRKRLHARIWQDFGRTIVLVH